MPNHNSQAQATNLLKFDAHLGIVSSDGRNSIPWPDHFSNEDWYATKRALEEYPALSSRSAKLNNARLAANKIAQEIKRISKSACEEPDSTAPEQILDLSKKLLALLTDIPEGGK